MHSSPSVLMLLVQRRARRVVLCLAVIGLLVATLLNSDQIRQASSSPKGSDPWHSKYLDYLKLWARPEPTQAPKKQSTVPEAEVDEVDEVGTSHSRLPSHQWRSDGLVDVNPHGAHPIYELVRQAEAQWQAKQRRASKTLKQAVKEYKRRYKRLPPKGFDHWWDYVQKHNVQLPDEYDRILQDLEPYWGIDPRDLQASQRDWEAHRESFTFGKTSDEDVFTILNSSLQADRKDAFLRWRAQPQLDILNEVHQYIPAFRATMSPHDQPNLFADWQWRNAAVEAASKGTYLKKPEHMEPLQRLGWSGACPRDSPLYLNPPGLLQEPTPQESKTFIHDHRATMDPCYHPQHTLNHGIYLFWDSHPVPHRFTAPQFSLSPTTLHIDIHAMSLGQASAFAEDDPSWEYKDDDNLFWRGSPTGMWHREGLNWRYSQRVRLVNLTAGPLIDNLEASLHYLRPNRRDNQPVGLPARLNRRKLNEALMDVAFAGEVSGCEGIACEVMERELRWVERMDSGPSGAGKYKYVIDVDGHAWSSRFRRLMGTNSLVFKSTIFPEWWTDRVQPWVHYVPIQIDYSDLYDSFIFFRGDLEGEGAHEEMARKIGAAGREWVLNYWRQEDVTAYMFRLYLEYARVMSEDREVMTYHPPQAN